MNNEAKTLLPVSTCDHAFFLPNAGTMDTFTAADKTPTPIGEPLQGAALVWISPQPTQRDVDRVLSRAKKVVNPPTWEPRCTVSQNRVTVAWSNPPQGALIYLEALIFPCRCTQADLDGYFSGSNWNTIFLNYENHDLIKASNQGLDHSIQYYVDRDSDTCVITTMLVFPAESESLLMAFSSRLFPDLKTCA